MTNFLFSAVLTVHVLVGLGVIGLVLVQHGKGADMGAAFGSGASGSLFGSSGSANFLSRTTAVLAAVFFITSLGLSYLASNKPSAPASVMQGVQSEPASDVVPAVPQAPADDSKAQSIPK
jgi:preprotein translocase subunit SecG